MRRGISGGQKKRVTTGMYQLLGILEQMAYIIDRISNKVFMFFLKTIR